MVYTSGLFLSTAALCLWISVVNSQHCRVEDTKTCHDPEEFKETFRKVLQQLSSTLVVKDIRRAGRSSTANVTVLSAFADIGKLPAVHHSEKKDPSLYFKWLEIYKAIRNPLVFFTDQVSIAERVLDVRRNNSEQTVVIIYEKYSSWAFRLVPRLQQIFNDPIYPKHYPNTIVPEYACVNHAKYEFMQILSLWNPFKTKAAAWVDIGIYKQSAEEKDFRPFTIATLPGFDDNKITLNYIRDPRPFELNHRFIMMRSPAIYAGGFWIGNMNVMSNFTADYRKHLEVLLDEGLANCDEQILACMYVEGTAFKPEVSVQKFKASAYTDCDRWLCLGHKTREYGFL